MDTQNLKTKVEQLRFIDNYNNKLVGRRFISLHQPPFHKFIAGRQFKIMQGQSNNPSRWRSFGMAEVLWIEPVKLNQLTEFVAGALTGYGLVKTNEIYSVMYSDHIRKHGMDARFVIVHWCKPDEYFQKIEGPEYANGSNKVIDMKLRPAHRLNVVKADQQTSMFT